MGRDGEEEIPKETHLRGVVYLMRTRARPRDTGQTVDSACFAREKEEMDKNPQCVEVNVLRNKT